MNRLARWDNPVFRRELIRLKRRTTSHPFQSLLIIFALAGILSSLFVLLLSMYPSAYGEHLIWMFYPAWTIWVIYAVTVSQTIIASIGILGAEYTYQTWEPLIITGISARRIMVGTWLAALHRVRGWIFFLVIARIAVLPVYLIVSAKVAPFECQYFSGNCIWQPFVYSTGWILAITTTVIFTLLDILCCSIIGLAASVIMRHSRFAATFAVLLRFSPLIIFMMFGFNDNNFWEWWAAPAFALVDGGTAPAIQLIMPMLPSYVTFNPLSGLALIAAALMVLFLTVVFGTLTILRLNGASAQRRQS